MTYTVKPESPTHSLILDEAGNWIATVDTKDAPDRAEAVRKAIEESDAARAKRTNSTDR